MGPKNPTSIRLDDETTAQLDAFVEASNQFDSRAQAIRYAIRKYLQSTQAAGDDVVFEETKDGVSGRFKTNKNEGSHD